MDDDEPPLNSAEQILSTSSRWKSFRCTWHSATRAERSTMTQPVTETKRINGTTSRRWTGWEINGEQISSTRRQFFRLLRLKSIFHRQTKRSVDGVHARRPQIRTFAQRKDVHPTEGREWERVERDEQNDHSSADSNRLSIPSRWRLFPLRIHSKFLCRGFTRRTLS